MKFLLFMVLFSSIIYSQTHYVGAPGTGPGGTNPEYSTLRDACLALDNKTWGESEKLIVTSDLTEPTGVKLIGQYIKIYAMPETNPVITFTPFDTTFTQWGFSLYGGNMEVKGLTFQGDSSSAINIIPFTFGGGGDGQFGQPNFVEDCKFYYRSQTVFKDSSLYCAIMMEGGQVYLKNCIVDADYPGISGYAVGIIALSAFDIVIQGCGIEARNIGILWAGGSRTSIIKDNKITINQISRSIHSYGIWEKGYTYPGHEIKGNDIKLSRNHYSANSGATGISIRSGGVIENNTISDFYLCDEHGDSTLTGIWLEFPNNTLKGNTITLNNVFQDFAYYSAVVATREGLLRNNTFNVEENDFPAFVINYSGTGDGDGGTGALNSDYNKFNVSEATFIGMYMGIPAKSLEQWQEFTGQDTHSNFTPLRGISSVTNNVPAKYELQQNYPNPFNPTTTIKYSIKTDGFVSLKLYDILGNEVRTLVNDNLPAGEHTYNLNAAELSSGVYIYSLNAGGNKFTRKMMVIK